VINDYRLVSGLKMQRHRTAFRMIEAANTKAAELVWTRQGCCCCAEALQTLPAADGGSNSPLQPEHGHPGPAAGVAAVSPVCFVGWRECGGI